MEVPRSATDIDLRLFPVEDMEDEVAAETDTNLSETSSSELPEGTIPAISSTEQSQNDPPVKSTPDEPENKAPVTLSPEQLSALATMLASALQHGTSANRAPSNLQLEQNSPLGLVSAALDLSAQPSDTSTSDGRLTDLPSDAQGFSVLTAQAREALEWFRNVFGATFHNKVITKKNLSGIVERDDKFYENIFNLLDDNGNNVISLHEFAGGLHRLGRGRETPDRRITELTQVFLDESGPSGDLEKHEFITMCKKAKFAERLFGLFDLNDSGKVDYTKFMMGIDKLARSSKNMKWYTWAEKWFSKNASSDGRITKTQFLEYLNVSKSVFGERLFEVVDTDSSGSVDVTELMHVMYVLTQGSSKERLLLLFSIYDIDGDGTLSYEELKTVLRWCLSDSSFEEKEGLVEKLTDILFEQIDIDKNGGVTQPEFEDFVNSYPKIADNITISLANCLRPRPKKNIISSEKFQRNVDRTFTYMRNNKPLIGYWFIYVSVNVILFMTAAAKYWTDNNVFVVLARGPGSCLNFNSAFIVVLMFRHILTYLRSTWIGPYLPLDHSITAHKVTGAVIVGFSVIHTIMHVINFELLSNQTNVTWGEYLFTTQDGLGWVGGSACITGWVLVVVLAAIAVTSLPCLRRRGYFQLFYWSHWLFIGWWVTLVIHAPHFWKWLIGPATIYVLEKLWRHTRGRAMSLTAIRSIRAVDSKVSEVIIERPRGLKFSAGDYIFINIEDIAQFEWHPFTVSSAPEQTEYISLHIQAVGDWTKRLRALGETKTSVSRLNSVNSNVSTYVAHNKAPVLQNGGKAHPAVQRTTSLPTWNPDYKKPNYMRSRSIEEKQRDHSRDVEANNANSLVGLRAWIDGPYGSPSTTVYDVDHAIMIAAGIGVTPFASILQSIMFRQRRKRAICPKCNHIWKLVNDDGVVSVPKKVDFIWVTRTFSALEWFLGVLGELEEEQALLKAKDRFMNLNLHVTSALVQSDIRAVALQMALELCYQEEARDPLCGLRTRIQPGRPNWRKLFEKMLRKTEGRVCVFYCGPPQLEKALKKICTEYNLDFRAENF